MIYTNIIRLDLLCFVINYVALTSSWEWKIPVICLLRNAECYELEALLEFHLKGEEETNKRHSKQIRQQENDKPGYFVLNLTYF